MFKTKKRFLIIWGVLGLLLLGGSVGMHLNGRELVSKGKWVDGGDALSELVEAGHTGPVRVNDELVCQKPIVIDGEEYSLYEWWEERNTAETINEAERWEKYRRYNDVNEECEGYTFAGHRLKKSDVEIVKPSQKCEELGYWKFRACTKTLPATRDAQLQFDLEKGKWSPPLEETHGTKESAAALYNQPIIPGITMGLWAIVGGVLWWRKRDDWSSLTG